MISIVAIALASTLASGCSSTDISDHDASVVETAISSINEFCNVVDGKESVSIDSYDKLDKSAGDALGKLISLYEKNPAGTLRADSDRGSSSKTISQVLREVGERLTSCDPAQAERVRKAINRAS